MNKTIGAIKDEKPKFTKLYLKSSACKNRRAAQENNTYTYEPYFDNFYNNMTWNEIVCFVGKNLKLHQDMKYSVYYDRKIVWEKIRLFFIARTKRQDATCMISTTNVFSNADIILKIANNLIPSENTGNVENCIRLKPSIP